MAKKRHHSSVKNTFEAGMRETRPGHGVSYTSPFPKNGFIDHVIMKDYPSEAYDRFDYPYQSEEDIDRIERETARKLGASARSKRSPF